MFTLGVKDFFFSRQSLITSLRPALTEEVNVPPLVKTEGKGRSPQSEVRKSVIKKKLWYNVSLTEDKYDFFLFIMDWNTYLKCKTKGAQFPTSQMSHTNTIYSNVLRSKHEGRKRLHVFRNERSQYSKYFMSSEIIIRLDYDLNCFNLTPTMKIFFFFPYVLRLFLLGVLCCDFKKMLNVYMFDTHTVHILIYVYICI